MKKIISEELSQQIPGQPTQLPEPAGRSIKNFFIGLRMTTWKTFAAQRKFYRTK